MKVFVVMQGDQYEGASIAGIHESKETAVKAAMSLETFTGKEWQRNFMDDCWTCGIEWVEVVEWEVQK